MNILSLFDGMSCGQIAFKQLDIPIDNYYAYEIDKYAIKTTLHNFPNTKELGDVFEADFTAYEGIDFLVGGSPCFTKGHLVLTDKGYKDITEIQVGDMVLTHKGRYRKVIRTNKRKSDIVDVKIMGYPTFHTTTEHPFYTLERKKATWKEYNKLKSWRIFSTKPKWTKASELKPKVHFCGQHVGDSADINEHNIDTELAYILGRYVADGHIRKNKRSGRKNSYYYQVILSIGSSKIEQFKKNITQRHYSCYKHSENVYRVCFSSMELLSFIEQQGFGKGANNKVIPEFIYNLPRDLQFAFLRGYLDGDGHISEHQYSASTVSSKLAFGLQRLITQLYNVNVGVTVSSNDRQHKIGNREIHSNYPLYIIIWRENISKQSVAHIQDRIVWTQVKDIRKTVRFDTVYNIEVDEDNSYTVNNVIVHNCTYWSIAQSPDKRETTASGLGWELFSQYLRALHEAQPKYFIYENNKSMAKAIYESISAAFGFEPIMINSALVSAQNRQRYYWVGKRNEDGTYSKVDVQQPKDRGILLRDILDGADLTSNDKSYTLTASYNGAVPWNTIERSQRNMVAEPVRIPDTNTPDKARTLNAHYSNNAGTGEGSLENRLFNPNPCKQQVDLIAEPVNATKDNKSHTIKAQYYKNATANFISNKGFDASAVAEKVDTSVQVGALPRPNGELSTSQGFRIYSINGKSVTLTAGGGGVGGKTGLYAIPIEKDPEEKYLSKRVCTMTSKQGDRIYDINAKSICLTANGGNFGGYSGAYAIPIEFNDQDIPIKAISLTDGKIYKVYHVKDNTIEIKGKTYPIKLTDGYYIIRKLTVNECKRLQTVPEWFEFPVSDTQAYKQLG